MPYDIGPDGQARYRQSQNTRSSQGGNGFSGWWIVFILILLLVSYEIISKLGNKHAFINGSMDSTKVDSAKMDSAKMIAQPDRTIRSTIPKRKRRSRSGKNQSATHDIMDNSASSKSKELTNPLPDYPNEEKIKNDLVGKSLGNWQFNSLNEFKSFLVISDVFQNGLLYVTVDTELKDVYTGKLYNAEVWVNYVNRGYGWEFFRVDDNYHREIVTDNIQPQNSSPTDNSTESHQFSNTNTTQVRNIRTVNSNYNKKGYFSLNTRNVNRRLTFNDIRMPFRCDCTFNHNTRLSTTSSGQFTILDNVHFIINTNGNHTGNIYLYKNAILIVNGRLKGNVINNGGTIIQNKRIDGNIIEDSGKE